MSSKPSSPPRRVVIKVGSAVLARGGVIDPACIARLAADIGTWLDGDTRREIVLVSSGAVASGFRALGLARPPKLIADKQAAAAVGQPRLMAEWASAFEQLSASRAVAQVLLTAEDIDHRTRFLNARHTLERLLEARVIPIINENDSVSFSEIKLGDNDRLSALVASLVDADALVILSSVPGVLSDASGSSGHVVPEIHSLKEALSYVASGKSDIGTGGMATKVTAACQAAALGIEVVIADGGGLGIVQRVLAGAPLGTRFIAAGKARGFAARDRWIGFAARPKGTLKVDAGAKKALTGRGASLLPSGITAVEGEFSVGSLVGIAGPDGRLFARGLASYPSDDLARIKGCKASEIESKLGYRYSDEAVHRDDLVLIEES